MEYAKLISSHFGCSGQDDNIFTPCSYQLGPHVKGINKFKKNERERERERGKIFNENVFISIVHICRVQRKSFLHLAIWAS